MASFGCAPSRVLADEFDEGRLAALAVEFQYGVTQIESEVVAVEALARENLVRVGKGLEQVVDVLVVGHDLAGDPVGLRDRFLDRWAYDGQQVRDRAPRSVDVSRRGRDVASPVGESLCELRELVQPFGELVV